MKGGGGETNEEKEAFLKNYKNLQLEKKEKSACSSPALRKIKKKEGGGQSNKEGGRGTFLPFKKKAMFVKGDAGKRGE